MRKQCNVCGLLFEFFQKGNSPVVYIAGHLSKIHGLDWNPTSEIQLATSSQDCTVKVCPFLPITYECVQGSPNPPFGPDEVVGHLSPPSSCR